jgi:iron complex transport system substrate-binding protein
MNNRLTNAIALLLLIVAFALGSATAQDAAETGETRVVEHALGVTEVPARPERVAVISQVISVHLVSIGMVPVTVIDDFFYERSSAYQELFPEGLELNNITKVGPRGELDLEILVAVKPDMIIGEIFEAEYYDMLSRIAPTVLIDRGSNAGWKHSFDATVAAVGREAEAEAVRERYRAVVAALPEAAQSLEIAFIRPSGEGSFRLDGVNAFAGSVAADAGLSVTTSPEGVGEVAASAGFITFSAEQLRVLDTADLIVVPDWSTVNPEGEASIPIFEQNPLWTRLPAVQAGRVLSVPGQVYNGGTYVAAELLLRAIGEAVLEFSAERE